MSAPEVLLYTSALCPYCERAKRLLERKGAAWREVRVDREPGQLEAMLARTAGRRSVPQIFIGARHVGGFDELAALNTEGALDALLAGG